MQPNARDVYLETQVLTASPFKLRLMLIEGAIRFVNQTLHFWEVERHEEAVESLIRAREILGELMSSVSPEKSPFAKQILPLYGYIFRTLTEAQLQRDRQKMDDALRILAEERETWQLVCEQFASELESLQAETPTEIVAPTSISTQAAPPAASAPLSFDSYRPTNFSAGVPAPISPPITAHRSFSFEA
jgi:flagellar protein FliS